VPLGGRIPVRRGPEPLNNFHWELKAFSARAPDPEAHSPMISGLYAPRLPEDQGVRSPVELDRVVSR